MTRSPNHLRPLLTALAIMLAVAAVAMIGGMP